MAAMTNNMKNGIEASGGGGPPIGLPPPQQQQQQASQPSNNDSLMHQTHFMYQQQQQKHQAQKQMRLSPLPNGKTAMIFQIILPVFFSLTYVF